MRTLREAGESRLVQIGIRGSIVTRRDGPLIARHAASQLRAKVRTTGRVWQNRFYAYVLDDSH